MLQSSRNSLTTALEQASARIEAGDPAALGQDLLGIVGVLAENYALRRSLADAALTVDAKNGLLDSLFSSVVTADALGLAKQIVALRWVRAQDLLTGLEQSGITCLAASAQARGALGTVEEEVFRFTRLLAADHDLDRAVESTAGLDAKFGLLDALLAGKVAPESLSLVKQAVAHPRGKRVVEVLESYSAALAARQARSVADVTVAKPLDAGQAEKLAAALGKSYGRELALNVKVDPTVVGGVRVQVGDEVISSTIQDRLAELKRRLAS